MGTLQNGGEVFHSIRSRDNRMQLVEPYEPSSCKRHWRSPLTVTKGQHKVTQHSEVTNLKKEPSIKDVYPQVKVEVSAYVAPLPESNKKESINEGKMKHTAVIEDEVEDSPKFFCSRTSAWQFRKSDESSSAEPYVFISSSDITAAKKVLGSSKSPAKEKPASLSKLSSILPTGSQLNTQSTNHQLASLKLRKFGIELCKINENFRTSTLLHESDSAFKPSDIVPVSPSVPDKSLDWSETINPIHCSSTEDGVNSEVETHGLAWMNTPTALRDKVKIERTAATDHSSSKPLLSYADLLTTYVEDGVQRKLGRHVSSENSESTEDHSQTADALPEIFSDDNNSCDFHNPCIRQVEPEIPLNSESKTNEITEMKKSDIVENHLQIADVYSLSNAPWNNSVTKPDEISGPDVSIKEASLKQGKVLLGIVTSFQLPNEDVLPSQPNQENVPLTDAQPLQPTISANAITVKKESEEIPSEIPFNSCKVLNHDAVTDVPHPSSSLVPCASPVDNSNPKLTVHNFPATFQQVPANPIEPAAKHCNLPLLTSNESSSHPLHVIDGHIAPGSVIRPNNTPSQQLPGKTISASNGTLESGDEGRKCSSADMNINDSHSSIMHSDVQTVKTTALTGAAILQAVSLRQESGLHSNAQFSANQSIMISRTHHLSETVHHFDANSLGRKNDTYNHELANQYSIPGNINQHLESSAAPVQRNSAVYPTVSQVPPPSYDDTTRTSRNNEYQRMIIKLTNPHAGPVSNTVQPTATFKDQLQTPYYADTSRIHNTSQANATVYSQPSCAQTVPFSSVHTSSSRLQVSSSEIPSSCGVRVWQGNVIGSESVISLPPRSVTPLILKRKQSGFEIESQRVGSLPGAPHVASYTIQKSVSQTTAFNGDSASQINTSSRVEPEQNSSTIRKVNTEYLRKHFQKYQKYPDYLQYLRNFFCHPVSVSYPQQTSKTISSSVLVSKNCSGVDHNFAQTPRTTVLVGPSNTSVNTASGWSPRPASTELHSNNKHVNQESVSPPHISSPKLSESQLVKDTQPVITNQSTMPSGESLPITWHKRSSTDDSCREVNKRGKYMQLKASERMYSDHDDSLSDALTKSKNSHQPGQLASAHHQQNESPPSQPASLRRRGRPPGTTKAALKKRKWLQQQNKYITSTVTVMTTHLTKSKNSHQLRQLVRADDQQSELLPSQLTSLQRRGRPSGTPKDVLKERKPLEQQNKLRCNKYSNHYDSSSDTLAKSKNSHQPGQLASADHQQNEQSPSQPTSLRRRGRPPGTTKAMLKKRKWLQQLKLGYKKNVTALNVLEGDALPCLKQQSGILLAGASSAPGQVAGVNFTPLQTSTTTCSEAQQASTVVQSAPLLSSASSYATQPEASTIPHSKTFQTTNQKETSTTSSASQQTVVSSAKHVQILNTICTEPLQNSAKQDIVQQQIVSESDCAPQQSTDSQPNDGSESLLVCVSCKVTYNSLAHFNHHMEVSHGQTEKQQREMCDRVKSSNVPTSTGPVVGPVTLSTTGSFGDNSLASHETNVGIDSGVPFLESDKSPDSDSDEDLKSYLY